MKSKIFGGSLLIIGTSLGAGLLALPLVTASGGYIPSLMLFLSIWLLTVFCSFLLLEVTLWLPDGSNLLSMAKATLGNRGRFFVAILYSLLMYALLSAYISSGGDVLSALLKKTQITLPLETSSLLFTIILGAVVYKDIATVDRINRLLMFIKMSLYFWLIIIITPHIERKFLLFTHIREIFPATLIIVTAFGYSIIIPSLCRYMDRNVRDLRITLILGSFGALLCYLFWDLSVQGAIEPTFLNNIALKKHATSRLTEALNNIVKGGAVSHVSQMFTSICVTTSFLGVSLCLSDFITDGIQASRTGLSRALVMCITFFPALLLTAFFPGFFILGLRYAGLFCLSLLILFPCLMVWSGRYRKHFPSIYTVFGGKPALLSGIILSFSVFCYGVYQFI